MQLSVRYMRARLAPAAVAVVAALFRPAGWRRSVSLATLVITRTVLLLVGGGIVSYQLLEAKRLHLEQAIELHDLAGVSVISRIERNPGRGASASFNSQALRAAYSPQY